jgi:peptide-methionine (S)-S-oxide reductase|tara:strand:- start:1066 stop:1635 length:570 start_codon:yes stop_codon:yes gene_type:complete
MKVNKTDAMEIATLGGGCYWCLEAVFELLDGVCSVQSGASGGHTENPTYEELCSGKTGHVEVVQLKFDPCLITFGDILEIFFSIHDPTTVNRQGGDVGTQYRSAIFTHDPEQTRKARKVIEQLMVDEIWSDPVVTEVLNFQVFYPAEKSHQEYFRNNQNQPYCQIVINPKVSKVRTKFSEKLKTEDSEY